MTQLETFTFTGSKDGPHLLLTGRIHGNEPCGEMALKRLIEKLSTHELELQCGKLTIMPCCNPPATKVGKRFVDVNLNRIFSHNLVRDHIESSEAPLATEIMAHIDACDMVVDLHSFTEDMPPVVICVDDQNEQSRALAQACGIKRIECDSPFISAPHTQLLLHYARHNHKPAILVEAGQHDDPQSVEVAYQAVSNILSLHDMIDAPKPKPIQHDYLIVRGALYNREGEKLIFPLMDKDILEHGDAIFEMADGTIINADQGGLLFMRNANTPVGEEYAYICDVDDDWP
jgi:predicted deacylase